MGTRFHSFHRGNIIYSGVVRLSKLPIEYYYDDNLHGIEKCMGTPLKVDYNTSLATQGLFYCLDLH